MREIKVVVSSNALRRALRAVVYSEAVLFAGQAYSPNNSLGYRFGIPTATVVFDEGKVALVLGTDYGEIKATLKGEPIKEYESDTVRIILKSGDLFRKLLPLIPADQEVEISTAQVVALSSTLDFSVGGTNLVGLPIYGLRPDAKTMMDRAGRSMLFDNPENYHEARFVVPTSTLEMMPDALLAKQENPIFMVADGDGVSFHFKEAGEPAMVYHLSTAHLEGEFESSGVMVRLHPVLFFPAGYSPFMVFGKRAVHVKTEERVEPSPEPTPGGANRYYTTSFYWTEGETFEMKMMLTADAFSEFRLPYYPAARGKKGKQNAKGKK